MSTGARKRSEETATIPAPTSEVARDEAASVKVTFNANASPDPELLVGEDGLPSARPTAVPDYDVEAVAAASFASKRQQQLPLDLAIPIARRRASVDGAPLRAAFLLSHVDDRMTIAEIAQSAQIPIGDAIECFALLADLGLVELRGASNNPSAAPISEELGADGKPRPPTPKSGLRPRS